MGTNSNKIMDENKVMPTVGRIVLYKTRGSSDGKFPSTDQPAIITEVEENGNIGLTIFYPTGLNFCRGVERGQGGGQWDWMPFQKDGSTNKRSESTDGSAQLAAAITTATTF